MLAVVPLLSEKVVSNVSTYKSYQSVPSALVMTKTPYRPHKEISLLQKTFKAPVFSRTDTCSLRTLLGPSNTSQFFH